MLLAPKNAGVYNLAIDLQNSLRDLPELEKLQQRLRIAMPDLTEPKREAQAAYDPAKDKQRLEHLEQEIRRYEALLDLTAGKRRPAHADLRGIELSALRQRAALCGATMDSQKLLDQARTTHERQPTSASLGTLIAASFFRAHDELQKQSPEYAQLAARAGQTLGARTARLPARTRRFPRPPHPSKRQPAPGSGTAQGRRRPPFLFRTVDEWRSFGTSTPRNSVAGPKA